MCLFQSTKKGKMSFQQMAPDICIKCNRCMKALLIRTSFSVHLSMGCICMCLFIPSSRTRKPSRCQLPVVRFIQGRVCSEHRTLSQLDTKACCQRCEKEKQRKYVYFIKKMKVSMWLMCVLCIAKQTQRA